ncbi:DUF3179 domain-containing protein [Limibaculum sp. M0105]|uniref:DUF3179 domain-containing protein n=1 Tax=Thermohalobaculum xanthum TaxID=2753746 RepID=A0A8J7MAK6_9RHOB|nr:DUF3179 domain-containing protein [Thermohalobaculum xanthum]MBK0400845.1 DUF3179 domain-containing protein [Thermohalobaculum xanthum]
MRMTIISALGLVALLAAATLATAAEAPAAWLREWPRTDFTRSEVAFDEIRSGGPPRDGIPSIDAPRFAVLGSMARPPLPNEPVMSLEIAGDARAYPLSVLMWHEIVNDEVGGVPVAVTYCPLCNSGIVFRRVVAGEVTTFGTTGKLRHSDLVMYDRATESWWQQFEGRAILGARAGDVLAALPARLESFAQFATRHPDGTVLLPPAPGLRDYGRNPYVGYDRLAVPFLYDGTYDGPGSPLMRVVAVPGRAEAWSLDHLRARGRLEVDDLVLTLQPGQASALDSARIAEGRDVGTVTVERIGPGGTRGIVVHHVPFAFAFRAFNPGAPIHHVP